MHLVLIETSGNQAYIFATNKLRENVGASHLTYLAGTQYVIEAVNEAHKRRGKTVVVDTPGTFPELKAFLLDRKTANAPIMNDSDNDPSVEIIVATSSKAILMVREEDVAKSIIGSVTKKALKDAPGLSVYGVISESFLLGEKHLDEVVNEINERHESVRSRLTGPEHRFPRFPFAQACTTSSFPARYAEYFRPDNKTVFRSGVAQRKRENSELGRGRMQEITKIAAPNAILPRNLEKLEEAFPRTDWLAVIHADGNGLGQIFLEFGYASGCTDAQGWREYLDKLREFSLALDVCTINAYGKAVDNLQAYLQRKAVSEKASIENENTVPLLPLVLGGDDLTVICDGRYAIQFAQDFLTAFESETKQANGPHLLGVIGQIAEKTLGDRRLSSCAGVAIVKPNFPFYAAYRLAEDLLQSAKKVKDKLKREHNGLKDVPYPASALDYHVLYDSSGADLNRLRAEQTVDMGSVRLYSRPYVVTPEEDLKNFNADDQEKQQGVDRWRRHRHWTELRKRVEAMEEPDAQDLNRKALPSSMLNDLREGLFMGKEVADARMKLNWTRYQKDKTKKELFALLLCNTAQPSLFDSDDDNASITGFLDALDIVEFWCHRDRNPIAGE